MKASDELPHGGCFMSSQFLVIVIKRGLSTNENIYNVHYEFKCRLKIYCNK